MDDKTILEKYENMMNLLGISREKIDRLIDDTNKVNKMEEEYNSLKEKYDMLLEKYESVLEYKESAKSRIDKLVRTVTTIQEEKRVLLERMGNGKTHCTTEVDEKDIDSRISALERENKELKIQNDLFKEQFKKLSETHDEEKRKIEELYKDLKRIQTPNNTPNYGSLAGNYVNIPYSYTTTTNPISTPNFDIYNSSWNI